MVKDISKLVEITFVEFDTTISTVSDIGLAPKIGVDLTCDWVVIADSREVEEVFFGNRCPPLVFRDHCC
ncbi:hypothetical protein C438_00650 [Haloferax denitrificans ATCC 35960]|uniref:Uncharacterized protein n=1 Tax=Haloferax denitrificans ATCC 35960 TaxID=662478 RepID=M0JIW2_9EURY|nr:hypothetical protein C438_00650 [Haloferax denitrificans ATCC 35960]